MSMGAASASCTRESRCSGVRLTVSATSADNFWVRVEESSSPFSQCTLSSALVTQCTSELIRSLDGDGVNISTGAAAFGIVRVFNLFSAAHFILSLQARDSGQLVV